MKFSIRSRWVASGVCCAALVLAVSLIIPSKPADPKGLGQQSTESSDAGQAAASRSLPIATPAPLADTDSPDASQTREASLNPPPPPHRHDHAHHSLAAPASRQDGTATDSDPLDRAHPVFARFSDWLEQWRNADNLTEAQRQQLLSEGQTLALQRQSAMYSLIQKDPQLALALALAPEFQINLPPSIQSLLENRFEGVGDYTVMCTVPLPGREDEIVPITHNVILPDAEYRAFAYGNRAEQVTTFNQPMWGVSLLGVAALSENPVRLIAGQEKQSLLNQMPADAVCAISGSPVAAGQDPAPVSVGGEVRWLSDLSYYEQLNGAYLAAAGAQGSGLGEGVIGARPYSEGRKRLIIFRVAFADIPNPQLTDARARELIDLVGDYMEEVSYGRTTTAPAGEGSDVIQVTLNQNASFYDDNAGDLRNDVRDAAEADGIDLSLYDFDITATGSQPSFSWAGLGFVGAPGSWIRSGGNFSVGVTVHELGHNFGLPHANYWDTDGDSDLGPGGNEEYGDTFDVMGSGGSDNGHYNSKFKWRLGWIADEDFPRIDADGVYRLFALDDPASTGLRGLRVMHDASQDLHLEFRQAFTGNPWLMNGLGVRWGNAGGSSSQLIDTTPGSIDGKNDAAIVIGRTWSDPESNVHITPLRLGNTHPQSIDVAVHFGPFPENHAPQATVVASAQSVSPGAPVTFQIIASDSDGDDLAYAWDFGDGSFGPNAARVTHNWSGAGRYKVRCTVSDLKGGSSSHSALITVGTPSTFVIQGRVYRDQVPQAGVLVKATDNRYDYTDSDGTYTITRLNAGSYNVTAQLYPLSFAHPWFSSPVTVGPDAFNIDFLAVDLPLDDLVLVPDNAVWKYLDNGSDQGTAWREFNFDDSSWSSGPAELGYGDDDEATVVGYGPDADNKYITTYFRHRFVVENLAGLTNANLQFLRDDGGAVYLNGTEILRDNLPPGAGYNTPATDNSEATAAGSIPGNLLQPGTNVLAAEVHQDSGTSSDISFNISVQATSVTNLQGLSLVYISNPKDQSTFLQGDPVTVDAAAYHSGVSYDYADFFVNGEFYDMDDTAPFSTTHFSLPAGQHTLSVVVYDEQANPYTPPPVRIQIVDSSTPPPPTENLVALGSAWRYLDNGTDQGAAWRQIGFDDSAWATGLAELGYGDGDEATVVNFGVSNNKYITTYFRQSFLVEDASRIASLSAQLRRDDGAVVYLNGTEVLRSNMPEGPVDFRTFAASGISGDAEDELQSAVLDPSALVSGLNVVAVEIHQIDGTSSDISFEFGLDAQLTPPPSPGVEILSPADEASLHVAASIPVQIRATPADGQSIDQTTLYVDGNPEDTSSAPAAILAWTNPSLGTHDLFAVAQQSGGIQYTSATVSVEVVLPPLAQALVSPGSVWKYCDNGVPPAANWTASTFDDHRWLSGPARLGYGGDGEITTVSFGDDPNNKHITTWFRRVFQVDDPSAFGSLRLRLLRDDGARVFLNGQEILRDNLLTGPIEPTSLAVDAVGGTDESTFRETHHDPGLLQSGLNVLAVEIHQQSASSSDLGFDLALDGLSEASLSQGLFLSQPASGSVLTAPVALTVSAVTVGLEDVESVTFFADEMQIGQALQAPYEIDWNNPPAGSYTLTARAAYNGGNTTTSPAASLDILPAPMTISPVSLRLVSPGAPWQYLDDGSNQGSAWRQPEFNASSWPSGSSRLGYGLDGESTSLNQGNITTYFRRNVLVLEPAVFETLIFQFQRDDGAVVYLNGREVFRSNMPSTDIDHTTLALRTADGLEEQFYYEVAVPVAGSGLRVGQNTLAVELHQSSANSSDAGFDMSLLAQGSTAPRVFLGLPGSGSAYNRNQTITMEAFAWSGSQQRSISQIEFLLDGSPVGTATARPYRLETSIADAGIYDLSARATFSDGQMLDSTPVQISVGFEMVTETLIAPSSSWLYYDLGAFPGANWTAVDYNELGWKLGQARLGYGGDGENTTVSFGPDSQNKYPTTYFRYNFQVNPGSSLTNLIFRIQRDDGAVVWFDGQEVFRENMPEGPVGYETYAASSIPGSEEQAWFTHELGVPLLAPGTHTVAVEVHQGSASSSDLGFDLELLATGYRQQLPPPHITISRLGSNQIRLSWPVSAGSWQVQLASDLSDPIRWLSAPYPVVVINDEYTVTLTTTVDRFFRLIQD